MITKYLLDTNVLSEPLKKNPNAPLLAKLQLNSGLIITATPVLHELYFGCYRLPSSRKKKVIATYIREVITNTMMVLPYCDEAAQWHAEERARLSGIGQTPSFVDGQIAAIAYIHGAILVTRNRSDFQPFSGLAVENWYWK
jgi:tRNA(fMet)-specific endonuclease VapC